jgi:hypothetical protein
MFPGGNPKGFKHEGETSMSVKSFHRSALCYAAFRTI